MYCFTLKYSLMSFRILTIHYSDVRGKWLSCEFGILTLLCSVKGALCSFGEETFIRSEKLN